MLIGLNSGVKLVNLRYVESWQLDLRGFVPYKIDHASNKLKSIKYVWRCKFLYFREVRERMFLSTCNTYFKYATAKNIYAFSLYYTFQIALKRGKAYGSQ